MLGGYPRGSRIAVLALRRSWLLLTEVGDIR